MLIIITVIYCYCICFCICLYCICCCTCYCYFNNILFFFLEKVSSCRYKPIKVLLLGKFKNKKSQAQYRCTYFIYASYRLGRLVLYIKLTKRVCLNLQSYTVCVSACVVCVCGRRYTVDVSEDEQCDKLMCFMPRILFTGETIIQFQLQFDTKKTTLIDFTVRYEQPFRVSGHKFTHTEGPSHNFRIFKRPP